MGRLVGRLVAMLRSEYGKVSRGVGGCVGACVAATQGGGGRPPLLAGVEVRIGGYVRGFGRRSAASTAGWVGWEGCRDDAYTRNDEVKYCNGEGQDVSCTQPYTHLRPRCIYSPPYSPPPLIGV